MDYLVSFFFHYHFFLSPGVNQPLTYIFVLRMMYAAYEQLLNVRTIVDIDLITRQYTNIFMDIIKVSIMHK